LSKDISFDGRVVVITGAGRGIGRVCAHEFARRGANVVVNDIEADYARRVRAEIVTNGGVAIDVATSVSTPAGGREIIDAAIGEFGGVDVVISNAAILDLEDFGDLGVREIEEIHATNLMGAYWVCQPAWRLMKKNDYGRFVFMSSGTGMFGQNGSAPYGTSKAGLWGLMKALASEAEGTGICANVLMPSGNTSIGEAAYHKITGRGLDMIDYMFGARAAGSHRLQDDQSRFDPTVNVPMATYLASAQCILNGEGFTSAYGYYAKVFLGIANGWLAPNVEAVSAEDIKDHLDEILDITTFTTPMFAADKTAVIIERIDALALVDNFQGPPIP
jgi:NAD(P)-dependent dehydrogenase (short-subunit alcohol dehydrogenase family)